MSTAANEEIATLGGGCFWCLEAVFQEVQGVRHVESGYAGGSTPHPTYQQVCDGSTGHAEVIQVEFNPAQISFREILQIFFAVHDPTTLNRQGADIGTQYRSVLFYHSEEQRRIADELIAEMNEAKTWPRPIVTEIVPFQHFYKAEEYHQNYYRRNPGQGYCQVVINPKLAKFRKTFVEKMKSSG